MTIANRAARSYSFDLRTLNPDNATLGITSYTKGDIKFESGKESILPQTM